MNNSDVLDNKESGNAVLPRYKKAPVMTKKEKKQLKIGKDVGKATVSNVRVPASKAGLVLDLIRGRKLEEAKAICRNTPRKASPLIIKLLNSAEANAVNNNGLQSDLLFVAEAYADQGPTMKRIRPRAQGRAYRIRKRTSHITLILKERE